MNKRRARAILIACALLLALPCAARAETGDTDGEGDLSVRDGVELWMDAADWEALERAAAALPAGTRALWDELRLGERAEEIALTGDTDGVPKMTWSNVSRAVREALGGERGTLAATATGLIGLLLIGGLVNAVAADGKGGAADAAMLVCRCFTLTAVIGVFASGANEALRCVRGLTACMEIAAPALTTLMTAMGAVMSAGVFQPATAVLCEAVANVMQRVVTPLAVCGGVAGLFDLLTERARLSEFSALMKSAVKWTLGMTTTLYAAVTYVRGLSAASYDRVSIRAAKYAAGGMFPAVGGIVTGSFDTVLGCAGLVRNAAGVTAALLCVCAAVVPMLRILCTLWMLRAAAAIAQPVAEKRQAGMLTQCADTLSILLGACAAATAMFLVTVGLLFSAFGVG